MGRKEVGLEPVADIYQEPKGTLGTGIVSTQPVTPQKEGDWGRIRSYLASSSRRRSSLENAPTSGWGWTQRTPPRGGTGAFTTTTIRVRRDQANDQKATPYLLSELEAPEWTRAEWIGGRATNLFGEV